MILDLCKCVSSNFSAFLLSPASIWLRIPRCSESAFKYLFRVMDDLIRTKESWAASIFQLDTSLLFLLSLYGVLYTNSVHNRLLLISSPYFCISTYLHVQTFLMKIDANISSWIRSWTNDHRLWLQNNHPLSILYYPIELSIMPETLHNFKILFLTSRG